MPPFPMHVLGSARPFRYSFPPEHTALVIIDMQRDFLEPGGFGESLGNDVSKLTAIVPALQRLLAAWRTAGLLVVHTRENHAPDLSDCPPAKRNRGKPRLRIGDPGPMGRVLIRGEPGADIVDKLAPLPGEIVLDKREAFAWIGAVLIGGTAWARMTVFAEPLPLRSGGAPQNEPQPLLAPPTHKG